MLCLRPCPLHSIQRRLKSSFQNRKKNKKRWSSREKEGDDSTRWIRLNEPHKWYGVARDMKRTFVIHSGGTNSGKTYAALQRLSESKRGIYCSPLRLLAAEVNEKLRAKGLLCDLITGQERDLDSGNEEEKHISCTIEMAGLFIDTFSSQARSTFDIAVIDECQLISDKERGWAWTQTLLGIPAREIHVCGSPDMVPLIKRILKTTNELDDVRHEKYERLSPLKISQEALGSYRNIQSGDCVVAFSRNKLYQLKRQIERNRNNEVRCSIIYGSLPPSSRREQARLFNDGDSDQESILVATDSIGMGLNMRIKRIIFSRLDKFDGTQQRALTSNEIKQIAGRAGRYNVNVNNNDADGSIEKEVGYVTCLKGADMRKLRFAMNEKSTPIRGAYIFPSLHHLEILGIILDYKLTDEIVQKFWFDYQAKEYGLTETEIQYELDHRFGLNPLEDGTNGDEEKNNKQKRLEKQRKRRGLGANMQSVGHLIEQFGSIRRFARFLEEYLVENDLLDERWSRKLERKRDKLQRRREAARERALVRYELERVERGDTREVDISEVTTIAMGIGSESSRHPILTTLSQLLMYFQEAAERGNSDGLYQLSALDERISAARLIEHADLSFKDRFIMCLSPVDVDREEVSHAFQSFVYQYSTYPHIVKLNIDATTHFITPPTTAEEVRDLEGMFSICDLYLWFAQRFPDSFVEDQKATREGKHLSNLISQFLLSQPHDEKGQRGYDDGDYEEAKEGEEGEKHLS